MADDGIDGHRRGKRKEGEESVSKISLTNQIQLIQPGCGERAGWRGTGRPNLSRKTKFSVANGDRVKKNKMYWYDTYFLCSRKKEEKKNRSKDSRSGVGCADRET